MNLFQKIDSYVKDDALNDKLKENYCQILPFLSAMQSLSAHHLHHRGYVFNCIRFCWFVQDYTKTAAFMKLGWRIVIVGIVRIDHILADPRSIFLLSLTCEILTF